ncbi:N-acetylmuramoyl-L-alanine amidase [Flavobacteriaceae bacterium]|nr:N-acetylmuramoyl-L-alanine amidase [Flavobacteriaceae bacterium]MDB4496689.1 N-acetylmuramoyl-L-alanine amidase [Flavobacteriaceae bacterium]MDC1168238.1 N-acetylmuramoyl-L-alanine amidase [Flavobacteriaceae bacterium]
MNKELTYNNKFESIRYLVFFFVLYFLFFNPFESISQNDKFIVVLDAGHGGNDPGNTGNGYREKNIVLKVVKEIQLELKKIEGIKVILTRDEDMLINLWKRGEIANKAKANLFVSVHCDAHTSNAYGAGTFVLGLHANKRNFEVAKRENAVISLEENFKERYEGFDPNSQESVLGLTLLQEENLDKSFSLAAEIQQNFSQNLKRKNRGVKQAGFVVLHQTYMPSVLIELGFLTNKNEGKFLNSKVGQQKMAKEIAKSITKYYQKLKANTIVVNQDKNSDESKINTSFSNETKIEKEVIFKIQIASSKNKIKVKSYNFRGLRNVQRVKVGSYYKYYYGITSNYKEVKNALLKAKKKGYSDAYIAAFENGEKTSLSKVLK